MKNDEEQTEMNDDEETEMTSYYWSWSSFGLELDSAEAYRQRSEYEVKTKEDLLNPPSDEVFGHIELEAPCLRVECGQDVKRIIEGMLNSGEELIFDGPHNFRIKRDGTSSALSVSEILDYLEQSDEMSIEGRKGVLSHDVSSRPENMVLRVLPVPPKLLRENMKHGNDLTMKLLDIIIINGRLVEYKKLGAPSHLQHIGLEFHLQDLGELLQYHITTYLDNETLGIPPARLSSGDSMFTIAQLLKGAPDPTGEGSKNLIRRKG